MTALALFWFLVLTTALVLVGLRLMFEHDPVAHPAPPRSHEPDPFEATGSSFR